MIEKRVLIAFGGNALIKATEKGTVSEQIKNAEEAAENLAPLLLEYKNVVIVHGNGPQVGQNLIRVEEGVTKVPPLPLDVCVAETQGSMGFIIEKAIRNELLKLNIKREVITLLSQVEVDPNDPAFKNPTKPIGPFYTAYRAKHLMEVEKWPMVEDSGRGFRKVVASPKPLKILGIDALREIYDSGFILISGGGGGIPVVRNSDGFYKGIEAVIDKDRTSVLMAIELDVEELIFLTSVPNIYINFGKPDQKPIKEMSLEEAMKYHKEGQFPPGSMGPKIEAASHFLAKKGGEVLLTDAKNLKEATRGNSGTIIYHKLNREIA